ncbi:MAG: hypothetical protein Q9222_000294 [Ikaeria aurantiellina]
MANRQELRILCFGASITAGFYSGGSKYHPYAIRLKDRLQTALPSRTIIIEVDGLPGDRVLAGEYASRLNPCLNNQAAKRYDWIIFQGGGNDLGAGSDPSAIFEELKKLWKTALDGGANVMALTVTETDNQSKPVRRRCFAADICKKVPYAGMDPELRRKVFDDGLHFKPAGYDMIGDAIADRLIEILETPAARL